MTDPRWERLPCGRDKERLLEIVADGRPVAAGSHEATCPYCQAALAELNSLWAPVREWSSRPTPVPTHLVRTVIARVRRMTQSPHHVVAATAKGVTSVTSWVIAQFGAEAALRVPGVVSVGPNDLGTSLHATPVCSAGAPTPWRSPKSGPKRCRWRSASQSAP